MIRTIIRLFSLLIIVLVLVPRLLSAPTTPTAPAATQQPAASQPVITEYAPSPEQDAKAVAYSSENYRHYFVNACYALVVFLLVLRFRIAPKFRDWAERVSPRRFVQGIIYTPLLLLTVALLTLPSDLWDQSLSQSFGLSVQSWGSWSVDWITNQALMLVVSTILVWILYAVIRRSARRWWLYFWLASIPVLMVVFFLQPVVIDPLFYKFAPLQPSQPVLVAEIQKVMQHGGMNIPPERMFEMNASSKLTGVNAYVTGFGSSKRVVVWDTTIAKATIPETLFVFGHEMGHYALLHSPKEIGIDATLLLFLLYFGYRLARWLLGLWGESWGVRGLDDWASLPALLIIISVLGFVATPAFNAVSRYYEQEADRYGLEVIHGIVPDQGQVAAHYFEKSGEINLADPHPSAFIEIWFFDHPTRPERVHFVATYDPWSHGEAGKYVP